MTIRLARFGMFLPPVLFVLFFALYTVMWQRGAEAMRDEIAAFAAREAAAGRSFTYRSVEVGGYPLNLRGTVGDVRWESPAIGAFTADEVLVATLPYDVSRIIFMPRGQQAVTAGGESYDLEADDLRFNLERGFVAVEGHGIALRGTARTITVADLIANQQRLAEGVTVAVSVKGLNLGGEAAIEVPFFDLAGSRQTGTLTISALQTGIARTGETAPTQIAAKGEMRFGPQEDLSGEIELRFRNEAPLLDILGEAGALDPKVTDTAIDLLGLMTDQGTKEVTLPLTIDEGRVRLGVIPLGRLPQAAR